jgi:hypothetical protein
MQTLVFKLALAVVLATGVMFLLATALSGISESANATIANAETARSASLNESIAYLQK